MEDTKKKIYGPVLPATSSAKQESFEDNSSETKVSKEEKPASTQAYGPALPPHLQKVNEPVVASIGPSLPPHLREKLKEEAPDENFDNESSEEDDIYGPVLPGQELKSKSAIALEERALEMKLSQLNPEEQKKEREEWMIELPTVSASKLGLGPRQFRPNAGPDMSDRSLWTNTPNEKKQKKADSRDLRREMESSELRKRDKEQEKMAKKHKRESESLVELHQKKQKKDKGDGPKERVPFNRETDLQVNRFDEAQKAAVLKKAQLLDDRFSSGKTKYL
ncbi:GPALPP motifs-containing protein 1 [Coccinella septempunctata]|uniref:GPALPP motifs-containing protein 1 n=1 Tax=Coccinella septempunctata TaxID=41139 RepID=UPI001D08082F|nr:GPALPP motifs-containing protein 1 [Coccinella septempunctata]